MQSFLPSSLCSVVFLLIAPALADYQRKPQLAGLWCRLPMPAMDWLELANNALSDRFCCIRLCWVSLIMHRRLFIFRFLRLTRVNTVNMNTPLIENNSIQFLIIIIIITPRTDKELSWHFSGTRSSLEAVRCKYVYYTFLMSSRFCTRVLWKLPWGSNYPTSHT
jgi:hypothetical protein